MTIVILVIIRMILGTTNTATISTVLPLRMKNWADATTVRVRTPSSTRGTPQDVKAILLGVRGAL